MDIKTQIINIETGLKKQSKPVSELCARVGINESTWQRWKSGKTESPRFVTWMRVQAEFEAMTNQSHQLSG